MAKLALQSELSLRRLLAGFGHKLGLAPAYADAMAQVHLQLDPGWQAWDTWLKTCLGCKQDPESCRFLNPGPGDIVTGASPADVQAANAVMIETGRIEECPGYVAEE